MKKRLLLGCAVLAVAAAPGYKVTDHIKIGGMGTFWDYVYVDADATRIYVSHANQTEVIDTKTNKSVAETPRVHGIAVAADLGKWREVVQAWALKYKSSHNIEGMLDWYRDGIPKHRSNGRGGGVEIDLMQLLNGATQ